MVVLPSVTEMSALECSVASSSAVSMTSSDGSETGFPESESPFAPVRGTVGGVTVLSLRALRYKASLLVMIRDISSLLICYRLSGMSSCKKTSPIILLLKKVEGSFVPASGALVC